MDDLDITEDDLEEYFAGVIGEYLDNADLDVVEDLMLQIPSSLVEFPLKHTFTPNMYIREILMPAGSLLTSRVHNTEHPFSILEGKAIVFMPGGGTEELCAGYSGITRKGTRRALYIEEDCRWVTYHALSLEEEIHRQNNMNDSDLAKKVTDRIVISRELLGSGKTTFEIYSDKLKERKCLM